MRVSGRHRLFPFIALQSKYGYIEDTTEVIYALASPITRFLLARTRSPRTFLPRGERILCHETFRYFGKALARKLELSSNGHGDGMALIAVQLCTRAHFKFHLLSQLTSPSSGNASEAGRIDSLVTERNEVRARLFPRASLRASKEKIHQEHTN